MNKLLVSSLIAMGFVGVTLAQEPQPQQRPEPSTQPSTSETEASGPIRPGETPTQGAKQQAEERQQAEDARPATSPTEGTAADKTPPGRTPTTPGTEQRTGQGSAIGSEIVGASVVTPANAPLGEVVDVVFAAQSQQPEFVVITSEGKSVAVPYAVANSMMTGDKVVIDRSKLQSAPKVREGQWRDEATSGTWKKESTRYWEQDRG